MNKRVILVHGWGGGPHGGWFSWIRAQCVNNGITVIAPQLPHPDTPTREDWVEELAKSVGSLDEQTYFIGHSLGCQTILHYLSQHKENSRAGGAIFVAGFFDTLTGISEEEMILWKKWQSATLDTEKIQAHLKQSVAIFSDNDPHVPLREERSFREKLNARTLILHNKGHFSGGDGQFDFPLLWNELQKMMR